MISEGIGNFEICENSDLLVSGRIYQPECGPRMCKEEVKVTQRNIVSEDDNFRLTSKDVYKELKLKGYDYEGAFMGIISADNRGTYIEIHILQFSIC